MAFKSQKTKNIQAVDSPIKSQIYNLITEQSVILSRLMGFIGLVGLCSLSILFVYIYSHPY